MGTYLALRAAGSACQPQQQYFVPAVFLVLK